MRFAMGSNGMQEFVTAKEMDIRGPVGDWHALRSNPDYKADWRAHGGAPPVVHSEGFALRVQTEADVEAARWGLLAWEDPKERSKFKPFWIDEEMLEATVEEPGEPVGVIARATEQNIPGLHLLNGVLVLKVQRGRRVEQIRILEGDSFDMERSVLQVHHEFDVLPLTAMPRLANLAAMMTARKRPASNR